MCNCYKLLYSIAGWSDNRVVEIKFVPKMVNLLYGMY